jgi:glutathione S-transferase
VKLLYQTHSPYARKVLVLAHEAGLAERIEVIHHETSPTRRNDEVFALNPLGKVPVLIPDAGPALFDSDVICEFLDGLHGGPRFIPAAPAARWPVLRLQALAQGLCDAGIAVRHDTHRRPARYRYPAMARGQAEKLVAAYDFLERDEAALDARGRPDLGQVALATALSWLEFRELPAFAPGRPRLAAWYAAIAERPSMRATPLTGEVAD